MWKGASHKGANIKITNKEGETPYTITVHNTLKRKEIFYKHLQLIDLLKAHGYTEHFMMKTLLVHRFSIAHNTNQLCGMISCFGLFELTQSVNFFFERAENLLPKDFNKSMRRETLEIINESIKNSTRSADELFQEYKEGKTLLLATGWKKHTTSTIFAPDKEAKINRGERRDGIPSGIQLFYINKMFFRKTFIKFS